MPDPALDDLLARATDAVTLSQKHGASGVFAWANRSRNVSTQWRDGALEKVEESTSRGLSLALHVDGRYSTHSTTDLRTDRLNSFVTEAVALTRALQPDPFRALPDPALYEGRSAVDLELRDDAVLALDPAARSALCASMDARLHGKAKVVSATSWTSDGQDMGAGASSNGFSGAWESTNLWYGADVTLAEGEDKRPEESAWVGGRFLGGLPTPDSVADDALARALLRLGATKGPTFEGTLVVDPRVTGRLVGAVLRAASARSVQQGRSFLAGKGGKKLFSELFTLTDDPLRPRGLGSRPFDGEGIAARPLPLVESGVLRNLYVDTYYGKKSGMNPTTGGASNVVLSPGTQDLSALIATAGKGLYLTSWLGGNSDDATGDFSFGLRGHLIEGGKIGAPVSEMNVTGNLADLFSRLVAVGDAPFPYTSMLVPALVFQDVQFSGV